MVAFLALAAYANSLGNGFAYDDEAIIVKNDRVTEGRVVELLHSPYWPEAAEGTGLYRPVTVASYAVEWAVTGGRAFWFHLVNVLLHAGVCLLVLGLAARFLPLLPAAAGAAVFAVHPVHTEVVANVVGRAELYAAALALLACWLYLEGRRWGPAGRAGRLLGLGVLYLLALGSKEIAVTIPALFVALELVRGDGFRDALRAVRDELPAYALLAVTLGAYLLLRASALGGVLGESGAGSIVALETGERVLTSISLWGEYLRLMVFPMDLSADYGPAVFVASRGWNAQVALGALVILLLGAAAVAAWRREPAVTLGVLWFAVAVLPVTHLFFPTGTVLAERTLYLPSVGLAFAVGGLVHLVVEAEGDARLRRVAAGAALAAGIALFVKTVDRNPSWFSNHTVMNTLAAEHPESFRALWSRAQGLERVGELQEAERYMEAAREMAPNQHRLLLEMGLLQRKMGELEEAERYLRRAVRDRGLGEAAHFELANVLILRDQPREAIRAAAEGIALVGSTGKLWGTVSEAYIALGSRDAAIRARRAALAADPESRRNWERLADLLESEGRNREAARARARAAELPREDR